MNFFKEQHDKLLLEKPDGVSHDAASCNFCTPANLVGHEISTEGGDMTTYNDEDFTKAVQAAVAPVQAELDRLRASLATSEVETQIAEAVAGVTAELDAAKADLDSAMVRATAAEKERDDIVAYLEAQAQEIAQAAERESKREARRAAVKEASSLTDEYIDANLDRWVAQDDETFEAVLADWKAIPKSVATEENSEGEQSQLRDTAINNTRNEGGKTSDSKLVFGAMVGGTDIRKII